LIEDERLTQLVEPVPKGICESSGHIDVERVGEEKERVFDGV
jgi:hypothetical protein